MSRKKRKKPEYQLLTRGGDAGFWEELYSYPPWENTHFNNYGYSPVDESVETLREKYQVQMYREAMKNVSPSSWGSLLEVGCGSCGGLQYIQETHDRKKLAGVDISEKIIRISRERLGARLELISAPAEDLPFASRSFDLVLSVESSNFFSDPGRAFGEIQRVLKPGGWLVLADFRLRPYIEDLLSILTASGLHVQSSRDITGHVVQACERDSERRNRFLSTYAEGDKAKYYREYLGTRESRQYLLFKRRLYTYLLITCRC